MLKLRGIWMVPLPIFRLALDSSWDEVNKFCWVLIFRCTQIIFVDQQDCNQSNHQGCNQQLRIWRSRFRYFLKFWAIIKIYDNSIKFLRFVNSFSANTSACFLSIRVVTSNYCLEETVSIEPLPYYILHWTLMDQHCQNLQHVLISPISQFLFGHN